MKWSEMSYNWYCRCDIEPDVFDKENDPTESEWLFWIYEDEKNVKDGLDLSIDNLFGG